METVGNDPGPWEVLSSDVAVGLGQIHDDEPDVVFARQAPQIAIQTGLRASEAMGFNPCRAFAISCSWL